MHTVSCAFIATNVARFDQRLYAHFTVDAHVWQRAARHIARVYRIYRYAHCTVASPLCTQRRCQFMKGNGRIQFSTANRENHKFIVYYGQRCVQRTEDQHSHTHTHTHLLTRRLKNTYFVAIFQLNAKLNEFRRDVQDRIACYQRRTIYKYCRKMHLEHLSIAAYSMLDASYNYYSSLVEGGTYARAHEPNVLNIRTFDRERVQLNLFAYELFKSHFQRISSITRAQYKLICATKAMLILTISSFISDCPS